MNYNILDNAKGERFITFFIAIFDLENNKINYINAGHNPPMLISNPKMDPLPATNAGSAIHHALLGVKFEERAKAVGATCIVRIEAQPVPGTPTPEAFLIQHLKP